MKVDKTLKTSTLGRFNGISISSAGILLIFVCIATLSDGKNSVAAFGGIVLSIVMISHGLLRLFGEITFDESGIEIRIFKKRVKKIYISDFHHYTNGITFGLGTRHEAIQFRSKENRVLFNASDVDFENAIETAKIWANANGLQDETTDDSSW